MAAKDTFGSDGNRPADAVPDFYLSLQSFTNLYLRGAYAGDLLQGWYTQQQSR
jgi:hypothetical protein